MLNFRSNGNSIQLIAPAGGVTGGQLKKVGGFVGVVVASAAEGASYTLKLKGEYSGVPKKTGEAWAIGDKLYYNNADQLEKTAANGEFAGYAGDIALSADTAGTVYLKH